MELFFSSKYVFMKQPSKGCIGFFFLKLLFFHLKPWPHFRGTYWKKLFVVYSVVILFVEPNLKLKEKMYYSEKEKYCSRNSKQNKKQNFMLRGNVERKENNIYDAKRMSSPLWTCNTWFKKLIKKLFIFFLSIAAVNPYILAFSAHFWVSCWFLVGKIRK